MSSPDDFDPLEPVNVSRADGNTLAPAPRQWFVDYLPVTGDNDVKLFVDGERYMEALHAALSGATSEVLLTGLHFDPGLLLLRGAAAKAAYEKLKDYGHWPFLGGRGELVNHPDSLVQVLRRAAKRGCKIYLIVNQFWKDEGTGLWDPLRPRIVKMGNLNWYLTQTLTLFERLADLPNVHCRTDVHPRGVMSTHHQKTIVIDRQTCFLGGIDLTATDGDRWDTNAHPIPADGTQDIRQYGLPEHLWHDVHCRVRGRAVQFVLDNFRARWNHGHFYKNLKMETRTEIVSGLDIRYAKVTTEIVSDPDPKRETRPPVAQPDGAYQELTRQHASAVVHTRGSSKVEGSKFGPDALKELTGTRVQVVRSMPVGAFTPKAQKPYWNLSPEDWERSTKDAYLIGIRAAREYIYLENQWVADEDIWAELEGAMKRNRANPRFRIVVVIPRRPLAAAGLGQQQDIDISGLVRRVQRACTDAPKKFGIYAPVQSVPANRRSPTEQRGPDDARAGRDWLGLSEADVEEFGDTESQIYVHSKIMIVDDRWSLIGSANAGGISLSGMFLNPHEVLYKPGSTPDTELSVIIYDKAFARNFRETLWKEHLQTSSVPGTVDAGADLFLETANRGTARIRHAVITQEQPKSPAERQRHVIPGVMIAVREQARILRTMAVEDEVRRVCEVVTPEPDEPLTLRPERGATTFTIVVTDPPPQYALWFWWWFLDENGSRWHLNEVGTEAMLVGYTRERNACLSPKMMLAMLEEPLRLPAVSNVPPPTMGQIQVCCQVLVMPAGIEPDPTDGRFAPEDGKRRRDLRYSFAVVLPLKLDRT